MTGEASSLAGAKAVRRIADRWPLNVGTCAVSCLLGAVIAFMYHSTFKWLVHVWLADKEYSHGFLVPLVSLYLVWSKRTQLAGLESRPRGLGGSLVLVISGSLFLAGRFGGFPLAEATSLLFLLPGIVLFVWGWNHLRVLILPLVYLQFMIPWFDSMLSRLYLPFQLAAATVGTALLQVLGYAVRRHGRYIILPELTLDVAEGCSGITFVLSVIAAGVLIVYLTQRTWLRGLMVILAGVLIAIGANWARVTVAGILAYHFGPTMVHGPFHIFQGWFVSQVGIIGMLLVNWAVARVPSPHEKLYARVPAARASARAGFKSTLGGGEKSARSAWRLPQMGVGGRLALVALFVTGVGVYSVGASPRPVPLRHALEQFPISAGTWSGEDSTWLKNDSPFPGTDEELRRIYNSAAGKAVQLYIGYFASQEEGRQLVYRGDKLPSGREVVLHSETRLGAAGRAKYTTIESAATRYEVLFWYRYGGRDILSRNMVRLMVMWDGVVHRRNNGAVVLLAVPAGPPSGSSPPAELLEFARLIAPLIPEYVY